MTPGVADLLRRAEAAPGDLYAVFGQTLAAARPRTGEAARAAAAGLLAGLPAGETRDRLQAVDPLLLTAVARAACGFPAVAGAAALPELLATLPVAPMLPTLAGPGIALPLATPGMPAFSDPAFDGWFAATGAGYGIGLYGEHRDIYRGAQFADAASAERRTLHLGLDVFAPAGTPVHAPLAGMVEWVAWNADPLDYGHTLLLRHEAQGVAFFTLYGHLAGDLPALCRVGQRVAAGQVVARLGDWPENGGWSPHLHLQVLASTLSQRGNFFGVGHRSLWKVWRQISPDPGRLAGLALTTGSE
jgi:murein DD-endopeptidase MepM/ murein hydrolase activator NlpD